MIEVMRPGLLDLVMDLGRPGYRSQGVPEGGAADAPALVLGNRLVGNPDNAAGLEMLLRGPQLRFTHALRIALAGADMAARLNGKPLATGQTYWVPAGGVLELGTARTGLRGYLAVAGGIAVPPVLGSRSTFLPGGFGGWQGRAPRTGDVLTLGQTKTGPLGSCAMSVNPGALRVLPGPQLAGFADAALHALSTAEYELTVNSNRTGLRLAGPALQYAGGEIASQAVLPGAIQVPPDGQPIILGWDGPVTGGYPVIAGVIAADLPRLAQLKPGDRVGFRFVGLEAAQREARQAQAMLEGVIRWDR